MAVVGGGLAGCSAALALADAGARVTVLTGDGAAATQAGLAHPFTARKGTPAWRFADAVDALDALLHRTGLQAAPRPGVLRPARDDRQARAFASVAAAHPDWATWYTPAAAAEAFPAVGAPLGALWIPRGRSLAFPALLAAVLGAAQRAGALVRHEHAVSVEGEGEAVVHLASGERCRFDVAVLCVGAGFDRFPVLGGYGLHPIKGQTVRLQRPATLPDLPAVSGGGYVITLPGAVVAGASYDHDFDSLAPSDAVTEELRGRAARLVPALADAPVLGTQVGVRVTRPGRMPLLGPVCPGGRVWAFTALGSKGLLTAPLLARDLPTYLTDPDRLPLEVRPPVADDSPPPA